MSFDSLRFDNSFLRELPGDPRTDTAPRQVRGACWSRVAPTPVSAPRLVAWSRDVGEMLGLGAGPRDAGEGASWAAVLSGNRVGAGMDPFATRYGGHQFGSWAGQLGDGRAISLGEVLTAEHGRQELQLKGAGPTPYSRRADGRAVLRSSLRELVCSEAMHHLGVPTTRALSLVVTGDGVERDMFYDGHVEVEPGAIVCRVAPSFLRLGHFEILAADRDVELLGKLFAYAVRTHFPSLSPDDGDGDAVVAFFDEVASRTMRLVVEWQRVGFVHGVMNTDNLSILGLTIDYGPYGFLEPYEPGWTPNTTDASGRRYRYGGQPNVALWNLERFARALAPLAGRASGPEGAEARLRAVLERHVEEAGPALLAMFGKKLGFDAEPGDEELVRDGLALLEEGQGDFTLFFRALGDVAALGADVDDAALVAPLAGAWYAPRAGDASPLVEWLRRLRRRWERDGMAGAARREEMSSLNPLYVPRNWLAKEAIDAATASDFAPLERLMSVLRSPYAEQPGATHYAEKRPDWARHVAGCAMLSCSS
jgi:serine/tyrosine/threonine adenylyltransferase